MLIVWRTNNNLWEIITENDVLIFSWKAHLEIDILYKSKANRYINWTLWFEAGYETSFWQKVFIL